VVVERLDRLVIAVEAEAVDSERSFTTRATVGNVGQGRSGGLSRPDIREHRRAEARTSKPRGQKSALR
jgi:hypothetical protein